MVARVRKDYLNRLICGVRKQIDNDIETVRIREECGEGAVTGRWADASVLCNVIESEVISNREIGCISREDYEAEVLAVRDRRLCELLTCIEELLCHVESDSESSVVLKAKVLLEEYDEYC